MLDPHILRSDPTQIKDLCHRRGIEFDMQSYIRLEDDRRSLQQQVQELQHKRNEGAQQVAEKMRNKKEVDSLRMEMQTINARLKEAKKKLDQILADLYAIQLQLPNLLDQSVPTGKDEKDNTEILIWGEKPVFNFKPKEHWELLPQMLDLELAAKMAGSRFSLLRGDLALVHRALAQMMLDVHTREHNYEEVYVPLMLKQDALVHTGQLPKFSEDLFHFQEKDSYLIPTAEVPLVNLVADRMLASAELPVKVTAYSSCFRSEAGSYGKDVKGMLRQHQFDKVELVQVTKAEESWNALEEMCQQAQKILQLLKLPYRVVTLCAGDIGFAAAKTYDIEVWLPGQERYREISSCSNCTDFQARRMRTRWRDKKGNRHLVHTLNASGLAVGRTLIAILENYQSADGKVKVPESLHSYLPSHLKQLG